MYKQRKEREKRQEEEEEEAEQIKKKLLVSCSLFVKDLSLLNSAGMQESWFVCFVHSLQRRHRRATYTHTYIHTCMHSNACQPFKGGTIHIMHTHIEKDTCITLLLVIIIIIKCNDKASP